MPSLTDDFLTDDSRIGDSRTGDSWIEIRLEAAPGAGERLGEALEAAGALSVTLEDAGDDPVLEPLPGEAPLWPHTAVVGLFARDADSDAVLEEVRRTLGLPATPAARISRLEGRAWEEVWRQDFHPMRFGDRLWVGPPDAPVPDDAIAVRLEPGLAFGTGTHPTTALCLMWLDAGGCPPGGRMIDYGCGSGILAVAAARLGAGTVQAADIDPQALQATRDNARANDVADIVEVHDPDTLSPGADCLVANILSQPLIDLAGRFATLVASGGSLAVSGILEDQAPRVARALVAAGFAIQGRDDLDGWVRIDARRA